jgi:hypothetical protein
MLIVTSLYISPSPPSSLFSLLVPPSSLPLSFTPHLSSYSLSLSLLELFVDVASILCAQIRFSIFLISHSQYYRRNYQLVEFARPRRLPWIDFNAKLYVPTSISVVHTYRYRGLFLHGIWFMRCSFLVSHYWCPCRTYQLVKFTCLPAFDRLS